jgi:hypothetical protein
MRPNLQVYMSQGEVSQTQQILPHTEHDSTGVWSWSNPLTICPTIEEGNTQHRPGEAKPQSKVVSQVEEVANQTEKWRPQILTTSLESLDWGTPCGFHSHCWWYEDHQQLANRHSIYNMITRSTRDSNPKGV